MNNSIDLERQATIDLEKQFNDYVVYDDEELLIDKLDKVNAENEKFRKSMRFDNKSMSRQVSDPAIFGKYDIPEDKNETASYITNKEFKGEISYIQDKKIYEEILSEFWDHLYTSYFIFSHMKEAKKYAIKTFIEK